MIRNVTMTVIVSVAIACEARAALVTVNDFDDILFWTGSGSNRAALVLDFGDPDYGDTLSPRAIAWGYRWGEAETRTMADMLFALAGQIQGGTAPVSGSDPRLSLVVDGTFLATMGYGVESIEYDSGGLPSEWAQQRSVITRDEDWTFYAAQFNAASAGGVWPENVFASNNVGISGTLLEDGGWYGVVATSFTSSYAFSQPVAAVPEPSGFVLAACGAAAWFAWRRRARAA